MSAKEQQHQNLLTDHSLPAGDAESESSRIYPGWPLAELPPRECGSPHVGLTRQAAHDLEAGLKNHRFDQDIMESSHQTEPDSKKYKDRPEDSN